MPGSNHILVIPKPEALGKTYIIGDVHGEIGGLQAVLARLNPQDILIIAGDLMDRGAIVIQKRVILSLRVSKSWSC